MAVQSNQAFWQNVEHLPKVNGFDFSAAGKPKHKDPKGKGPNGHFEDQIENMLFYLVVSTHLKKLVKMGIFPK